MQAFDLQSVDINTDRSKLDLDMIIDYLQNDSYWAVDRSASAILKSIQHAICFGVYHGNRQIGFARVVTDHATVFYLADVFVLPDYQNKGIGKLLTKYILDHPDLKGTRGILTTQTAHDFYREFGFNRENDVVQRRIMVLENNQK